MLELILKRAPGRSWSPAQLFEVLAASPLKLVLESANYTFPASEKQRAAPRMHSIAEIRQRTSETNEYFAIDYNYAAWNHKIEVVERPRLASTIFLGSAKREEPTRIFLPGLYSSVWHWRDDRRATRLARLEENWSLVLEAIDRLIDALSPASVYAVEEEHENDLARAHVAYWHDEACAQRELAAMGLVDGATSASGLFARLESLTVNREIIAVRKGGLLLMGGLVPSDHELRELFGEASR